MQAAEAEVARLKTLLEAAEKQAANQSSKLEEASNKLEGANSEALAARQAAASLEMDLATVRHEQQAKVCCFLSPIFP